MIVIRVELYSFGKVRELMCMHITNDGTLSDGSGDSPRGSYNVDLFRDGSRVDIARTGTVKDYPRGHHIGRLILRALASVFPEERHD